MNPISLLLSLLGNKSDKNNSFNEPMNTFDTGRAAPPAAPGSEITFTGGGALPMPSPSGVIDESGAATPPGGRVAPIEFGNPQRRNAMSNIMSFIKGL